MVEQDGLKTMCTICDGRGEFDKDHKYIKHIHQCYNCSGSGVLEQDGLKTMCKICDGRGEFNKDHKYIKYISKLLEMGLNKEEPKVEEIIKEKVEFPVKTNKFSGLDKQFDIMVTDVT